jgi:hypothetical protein
MAVTVPEHIGAIFIMNCVLWFILLRVFIGQYADPLCGDEPSSDWKQPTSITVCQ